MSPGAVSRRRETAAVAGALRTYRRRVVSIEPPGRIDGGDVLVAGRTIFIGRSSRTNQTGLEQVERFVAPFSYAVREVEVRGSLHLKSGVTAVSDETLLVNRRTVATEPFRGFQLVDVDPDEPSGANIVRVHDCLLYSAAYPRTLERLVQLGFGVTAVDVSEIAKAEGAVTCCSLIFQNQE